MAANFGKIFNKMSFFIEGCRRRSRVVPLLGERIEPNHVIRHDRLDRHGFEFLIGRDFLRYRIGNCPAGLNQNSPGSVFDILPGNFSRYFRRSIGNIMNDFSERRLDETEFVDARIRCKMTDETDVRSFRCRDRADAPVVRMVYVANLESRPLTGESARAHGRKAPLMLKLRERVRLIHEL